MRNIIKQKTIELVAVQTLKFTSEYSRIWFEGYERLKQDIRDGKEPSYCSIRDEFSFLSWPEVITHIEQEAEAIWKSLKEKRQSTKEDAIDKSTSNAEDNVMSIEDILSLKTELASLRESNSQLIQLRDHYKQVADESIKSLQAMCEEVLNTFTNSPERITEKYCKKKEIRTVTEAEIYAARTTENIH
ncbi:hypothetical protein [Xenorhabdus sp. KJ12.1]|uniref:hypothetical protein n=1 Tax=Xenorhabdus sp. KJ12.1 TaxID=1851571 RepID=UPI000C048991|nr:hypothetical protein [Xenorhabdus sp. KJ12.1]PHM72244.1 hypothetical protein Xekj_00522 [Xenorhabdus sp. KJ12.1]